ncbi:MAG TPA: thiamine pyrophosphate-binding protein, partial [Gemmatimonadales bacterium]|nr:thiamine pyrophosphate-binding protein [Gemmatimonadales bacterium]
MFLSPGSRSTPLAVAFDELAASARGVALHVVLDERVAAFAALGASRARRRPAILVCTSGTAAGHYLPAIMEAAESRVPLIAVTADRPPELHHCGAPQTIVQDAMFSRYVRWSATLP